MLKRLQDKYAGQPVRFLLFPCNQFDNQEPGSNAEVKAFAEKSVKLGPGSNVIMFAKSNLNNVSCGAKGPDVCAPSSKTCCPTNDPLYEYLLSAAPPGTIQWNFDKIVVDGSGKPLHGETILHGGDLDTVLGVVISRASVELAARPPSTERLPYFALAVLLFSVMGLATGAIVTQPRKQEEQNYIRLV
mmetsp:Transcript_99140/g.212428  ORF Transcript_99140/g.212428 Transcript_99140/m.212428 type:complete len:188 (-) Transcript_99140:114-677(-)